MNFGSSRCKSLISYVNEFQLSFGKFLLVIKVKQIYTNDVLTLKWCKAMIDSYLFFFLYAKVP